MAAAAVAGMAPAAPPTTSAGRQLACVRSSHVSSSPSPLTNPCPSIGNRGGRALTCSTGRTGRTGSTDSIRSTGITGITIRTGSAGRTGFRRTDQRFSHSSSRRLPSSRTGVNSRRALPGDDGMTPAPAPLQENAVPKETSPSFLTTSEQQPAPPPSALDSRQPEAGSGLGIDGPGPPLSARRGEQEGFPVGTLVRDRYKILGVLGRGGSGTMYEAEDLSASGTTSGTEAAAAARGGGGGGEEGCRVAVKALSLRGMRGWKDLELFQREASVLRNLSHPGIPEYIDFFEEDTPSTLQFCLVQRLAPGKSLAQLIAEGKRFSQDQVMDIMLQVLNVLQYLENLSPPVVHRDIKPENIVFDPATGRVQVVDFGGVQKVAALGPNGPLGSTVVGTYGFMAPEQFQNRASSQSDLYSLGATVLFLLSGGVPPSDFPQARLRLDFRSTLPQVGPGLAAVLEGLLEPTPEDRYRSAGDVIASVWKVRQGGRPEQPRPAQDQRQGQTQRQPQDQDQGWGQGWGLPAPGGGGGRGGGESLQERLRREETERQQGMREFQRGLSDRLQQEEQQRQRQMRTLEREVQERVRRDTGGLGGRNSEPLGGGGDPGVAGGEPWLYQDSAGALPLVQAGAREAGGAVWTGVAEGDRAPAGTKVVAEESPRRLRIEVPPLGLTASTMGTGTFALAWNGFIAFWTASAATAGAPLLFTAFSIPFWVVGFGLAKSALSSIAVAVELEVNERTFSITWRAGGVWSHTVEGRTEDISAVDVMTLQVQNGRPLLALEIKEGVNSHQFGSGLEPIELRWVARRITQFLARTLGRPSLNSPPPLNRSLY